MNLLVVDDSRFNLMQAKDILNSENMIINIFTASSGEEAFRILQSNDIDIMLLDIIMPNITGLDILKNIREQEKYKEMIIIMFTSLTDKEYLRKSFDLGANDYINKPIERTEFISRIKGAMRLRKHQKDLFYVMNELKEKNIKLERTTTELKRTQNQLIRSEKLSAIGQFAAGIAHEINNPLGYISSNNEILKKYINYYMEVIEKEKDIIHHIENNYKDDKALIEKIETSKEFEEEINFNFISSDVKELIQDSKEGIYKIKNIINSLMNFIQLDVKSRFKPNDFNNIVRSVVLPLKKEFEDRIDMEINLQKLPEVKCDDIQISQAINNIVINAIQCIQEFYTIPQKGKIIVSTFYKDNFIYCDIWNNGPKIPKDIINKLFDPFFTTKAVGKGTGLGLSICYDIIVNKHKGELLIESSDEKGTKFTIVTPLDL